MLIEYTPNKFTLWNRKSLRSFFVFGLKSKLSCTMEWKAFNFDQRTQYDTNFNVIMQLKISLKIIHLQSYRANK